MRTVLNRCVAWTALLVWLPTAAAAAPPATPEPEQAFRALYEREWQWRLRGFPRLATAAGDHRYDDRLERMDPATQQGRLRRWRSVRKRLAAIDASAMDPRARTDYAVYRNQLDNFIGDIESGAHVLVINSDTSFYSDLPRLGDEQPLHTPEDYDDYLARLSQVPRFFDDHEALLRDGLRTGMTVPRNALRGRTRELRVIAFAKQASDTPFFTPFKNLPAAFGGTQRQALAERATQVIEQRVLPAYRRFERFLATTYIPRARTTLAAKDLPNGLAYYRQQIRSYTTLNWDPDRIHQLGLSEVARIHSDMERTMRQTGFQGKFAQFLDFLRHDPRFYASSAQELLMHAAWTAKKIEAQLPRYFGTLPRQPYGIAPVPDAIAPFYTAGRYVGADPGSQQAALFWVNTHRLKSRPLYTQPALTLHEAVPGHHLQIALASEQRGQPAYRRHGYISAYGEGWALYAEYLGREMGIYETPYEEFGRLTYEMWRACRLVVDTGIHTRGWSRARAIAYMRAHTALSDHEVRTEVDRYISWPAQALSYKLGELRIRALRARAERALGERFDIRAFHDQVLSTGSVPLPVLEQHIEEWLQSLTSSPRAPR